MSFVGQRVDPRQELAAETAPHFPNLQFQVLINIFIIIFVFIIFIAIIKIKNLDKIMINLPNPPLLLFKVLIFNIIIFVMIKMIKMIKMINMIKMMINQPVQSCSRNQADSRKKQLEIILQGIN